jgi:hypothetical protein
VDYLGEDERYQWCLRSESRHRLVGGCLELVYLTTTVVSNGD